MFLCVDPQSTVGDVRLIPKTLERWENPHTKLDMHLYPASLSFRNNNTFPFN